MDAVSRSRPIGSDHPTRAYREIGAHKRFCDAFQPDRDDGSQARRNSSADRPIYYPRSNRTAVTLGCLTVQGDPLGPERVADRLRRFTKIYRGVVNRLHGRLPFETPVFRRFTRFTTFSRENFRVAPTAPHFHGSDPHCHQLSPGVVTPQNMEDYHSKRLFFGTVGTFHRPGTTGTESEFRCSYRRITPDHRSSSSTGWNTGPSEHPPPLLCRSSRFHCASFVFRIIRFCVPLRRLRVGMPAHDLCRIQSIVPPGVG